ncbi:MAG: hypothetical protein Q8R30_05435 [bacterium]|nr:hypothetical protein [bacterium]
MKYAGILSVAMFCILITSTAKANGFGITLDKAVGDYIVNVDYDALSGIYSGDPVQFAFQLFNKDRSDQPEFEDVWVSITPTGRGDLFPQPVFDGGLMGSAFPPSGMTFVFPYPGSYTLNIRYEKEYKTLAEASFPLEVEAGSRSVNGQSGFFHVTNDFLKGITVAMFIVMLAVVGRVLMGKKKI